MADEKVNFIISAKDNASRSVRGIKGELGGLGTAAGKTTGPMAALGKATGGLVTPSRLAIAGIAGATAALGLLTAGLAGAISELIDTERLNAQTAAAIKSTGGAARVTLPHIEALSEGLEQTTTTERQVVQEGANLLLTFTKVRNEVGRGNDIFDQATKTALDLSVALGTDMHSASMLLGKALNDPIKGVTALTRAGVQLTEQQKAQIKAFVAAGDTLSAQKIILAELTTQVGGSAEAYSKTTAGMVARFQNDVGNMFESIIVGAVKVADFLGQEITLPTIDWAAPSEAINAFVFQHKKSVSSMPSDAQIAALAAVRAVEEEYIKGGPVVATEAGKIAGMLPSEIAARVQEVRDAGMNQVVEFAAGMLEKQNDPMLAFDAMNRASETALTRGEEIARLKGQLTSKELAGGLLDERVEVRLAAQAARAEIVSRLEHLGIDASGWGANIGAALAGGLDSQFGVVKDAAGRLAGAVRGQTGIRSEPTDASSPLRGITKWGGNIAATLAKGMRGNLGVARDAAGALGSALVPSMGVGGAMAPAYAGAGMGGMGTVNITVNAPLSTPAAGQAFAREVTPELVREMRRQRIIN